MVEKMKLSKKNKDQFFRLFHSLLIYANLKKGSLKKELEPDDLFHFPLEYLLDMRMTVYNDPEIIDQFVADNPYGLNDDELEIVSNFNNFIRGKFLIVKYLKKYAVVLSQNEDGGVPYGVLTLNNSFEDMLGPYLPVLMKTTLLPFKGKIVYDGVINPYNIRFGSGIRKSFNASFQEAKARHGIVTSLPYDGREGKTDDLELLKVYLKNQYNRDVHWKEIEELRKKDERLEVYYHQKMGKVHSRDLKKILKEAGIENGWFGVLDGIIVGCGKTKKELSDNINGIVPENRKEHVLMFQMKR